MSLEKLVVRNDVLKMPEGEALGCSYRWPGGQYCAIHTDRGIIACGLYDCQIASRFGFAVAVARGTPEIPLKEPEDLLVAKIVEVSQPGLDIGIIPGMTGREALNILLLP
jgi:uncharacterized protein YunC (DUF1805 family)